MAAQARERFGQNSRYLLDLYHVCDYPAVWPGDKATVHRHRDALKASRLEEVLAALRERLAPADSPETEAPARAALRYLQNRLDQLDTYLTAKMREQQGSNR